MRVSRIAPIVCVVAGVALAGLTALGDAAPGIADAFDTKTASFAITFHGETSSYRDVLTVVMPAGVVTFNAVGGPPGDYTLTTGDGAVVQERARQWRWTAPDHPGLSTLTVDGPGKKDTIVVHASVRGRAEGVKG